MGRGRTGWGVGIDALGFPGKEYKAIIIMIAMISEKQTRGLNLYKLKCYVRFWMVLHLTLFSLVRLSLWDLVQLQMVDWPLEEGPVVEFTGKYQDI